MTPAASPRRGLLRWLPALAWMAIIFLLSAQGGLRVSEDAGVDRPFRIVAHLATFGLLAALLLWAIRGRCAPSGRDILAAVGLTLLYAFSDELHQSLVPGRDGRADDVIVDLAGAVVGVLLAAVVLTTLGRTDSADELEAARLDAEREQP